MADCNDTDDAPAGSIEDVREDLASVAERLRAHAEENTRQRAEGKAVSPGKERFLATEGGPTPKQNSFNPQPILLLRHSEQAAQRPIPRRPEVVRSSELEGPALPLESESLTVRDSTGTETDVITAGEEYTVECTVSNVGGLPARNTTVELYVEHMEPTAALDVEERSGELQLHPDGPSASPKAIPGIAGVTTMAPESQLLAVAYIEEGDEPPYTNTLFVWGEGGNVRVPEGRSFSIPTSLRDVASIGLFGLDLWDVTRADDSAPWDQGRFLEQSGIRLAGRTTVNVTTEASATLRNYDLTGRRSGGTGKVDRTATTVPQSGRSTVSLGFSPEAGAFPNSDLPDPPNQPPGAGRGITAIYARAYSLATSEVPGDWDALNHADSRFMARTEVKRTLQ